MFVKHQCLWINRHPILATALGANPVGLDWFSHLDFVVGVAISTTVMVSIYVVLWRIGAIRVEILGGPVGVQYRACCYLAATG